MGLFKKKKKNDLTPEQLDELRSIPLAGGGFSDFIDIGESNDGGDFILIENKSNRVVGGIGKVFKFVFISMMVVILTISAYLGLSYKVVPARVYGSTLEIGNYSIVSRYSEVNRNEIKNGSIVLVKGEDYNDLLPFIVDCNIYTVKGRKGLFLYCETQTGKVITVETIDVIYIVKP